MGKNKRGNFEKNHSLNKTRRNKIVLGSFKPKKKKKKNSSWGFFLFKKLKAKNLQKNKKTKSDF
jgi:hypothetical protein